MSLGADFPRRWQHTVPAYRARVFAELQAVCARLDPAATAPLPDLGEWPAPYAPVAPAAQARQQLSAALKSRFLREADDMIEEALEPVRRQLRQWLQTQLQALLDEQHKPAEPPSP